MRYIYNTYALIFNFISYGSHLESQRSSFLLTGVYELYDFSLDKKLK